jgi:hypothetical protein
MTMKERRLKAYDILSNVLGSDQVYYDPPESVKMKYPCFVYTLSKINKTEANNSSYLQHSRFDITFIRKQADSEVVDRLLHVKYCEHNRTFKSNDLYHDVFTLYI